jgi:hypothetical protein
LQTLLILKQAMKLLTAIAAISLSIAALMPSSAVAENTCDTSLPKNTSILNKAKLKGKTIYVYHDRKNRMSVVLPASIDRKQPRLQWLPNRGAVVIYCHNQETEGNWIVYNEMKLKVETGSKPRRKRSAT